MATNTNTPNVQPPQQEDPNQLTPQQIRDRAAGQPPQPQPPPAQQPPPPQPGQPPPAQQPPSGTQPPQPPPVQTSGVPRPQQMQDGSFMIQLPTGQRYIGRTAEEAYDNLATAQINASGTIRDLRDQAQRFQRGVQALSGGAPVDPATGNAKPVFEPGIYKQLNEQDPMMALQYGLQHLMGLNTMEEVVPAIEDMRYQTRDYAYTIAINKFRAAAPDFPNHQQAVDTLMDTMAAYHLPFTAENLVMVHNNLKVQNAYPNFQQQQQQQPQYQPSQPPMQPPAVAYNPNPQGPYAFDPGRGFSPYAPAAPVFQPPQPQYPVNAAPQNPYAPPQQNPYGAPPAYNPYANAQPPMAPGGFPSMPQVPLPPAPAGAPGQPFNPNGQANESALYSMDTNALRASIEANLLRQ